MQIRVRDDMNATADMVNRLEIDAQADRGSTLKANAGNADVETRARDLDKKMLDVELQLVVAHRTCTATTSGTSSRTRST